MSSKTVNYGLVKSLHLLLLIYVGIKFLFNLYVLATDSASFNPTLGWTVFKGVLVDVIAIIIYGGYGIAYWNNEKARYYLFFMTVPFIFEALRLLLKTQLVPTLIFQLLQVIVFSYLFIYLRKNFSIKREILRIRNSKHV